MKFKFGILAALALSAVSCNPLEKPYEQLDKENDPNAQVVKTLEEYVLTAADYTTISKAAVKAADGDAELIAAAEAVATECALNASVDKADYVPAIVEALVPSWQDGSVVNVTYNFSSGLTEAEKEYVGIIPFEIEDYGWEYDFYAPSHSAEDNIPAKLLASQGGAIEGDRVVVSYMSSETEPKSEGSETVAVAADFEDQTAEAAVAIEGWTNVLVKGENSWLCKEYSNQKYIQMSAYKATGEVESWLVMPATTITAEMFLTFDAKIGHPVGDAAFDVMVSENFDGVTINAADWSSITSKFTLPTPVEGGYTEFENVGQGSMAEYAGKDLYIAFRYTGDGTDATTTYQLDNVKLAAGSFTLVSDEKPCSTLYVFDGAKWKVDTDATLITPADYDAMGDPGKYDNFSSSTPAEDYLPTFFAQKFPYAKAGDTELAVYKYYGSSNMFDVDEYIFDGAKWTVNNNIEVIEKDTFIKADGNWMFDPTILYTIAHEDYEAVVAWTLENKPMYVDQDPAHGQNSEFWFGASYFYNNFRIDLVKRRGTDCDPDGVLADMDDVEAGIYIDNQVYKAITDIILPLHFADTPATNAAGGEQIIRATATVYNGQTVYYVMDFKVLGGGEFEFVSREIM